ncbi:MAG: glycoside hydrolase family 38 [Anaerolineae bacterium]|nr:glycoside hydrolase family 38 [Anaerolineae bacterium]
MTTSKVATKKAADKAIATKRRAHYVLSTHWDREWYQSFQDFRYQLVQLLDRVLDGIADGRLQGPFQTDGQSIILEDYLEVRPERRTQVERYAREGKLVIGPWYVLPDEFLLSGESLIRNLRVGREVARALGGVPSNAGFVCDIFGHNSQMPQIFAGFGIRGGFIWRGTNTYEARNVRWRGADGTELICYRFGKVGYCTFCTMVRHAFDPHHAFELEEAATDVEAHLDYEASFTDVDPLLLFDGGDHQEWDQKAYQAVSLIAQDGGGKYQLVHTSLDAYLEDLLAQADRIRTTLEGELREPGRFLGDDDQQWLIPGVLSSRVWIKQANAACETLLCHWAEPMSAFAHAALGREYPQGFLDVAWRWLLQNHPHDSICGCSIDAVHEDMKYRFSQSSKIAHRLTTEATKALAARIEGDLSADELRVVVFNPLPYPFDETAELTIQTPADWPTFNEFFGYEPKPAFRIYDAAGQEVAYQRMGQAMNRIKTRLHDEHFPESFRINDVRVSLPLRIPAMGYTTLTVRKGQPGHPTRHAAVPGLATGERAMENEHLAVTITSNGALTITDKRTGQTYTRLLTFEDCADIGDGWYHGMAVNDQVFTSAASHADVALVHNGPMLTTFRVRTHMAVPAAFDFAQMVRTGELVDLVIDSLVSLRPGADRVEVEATVHNNARDHRLRVLLPSGAEGAASYLADSPFDAVERPIALRADNHLYRELEVEARPQQTWTAVHDGTRGLAVISAGLYESAVRDLPERPVALTLFRSTRRTVNTDGEPEGQLLGPLTFRFWVAPLANAPDRIRLARLGQQLAAGLRDVQLHAQDLAVQGEAPLPPAASFLSVEGRRWSRARGRWATGSRCAPSTPPTRPRRRPSACRRALQPRGSRWTSRATPPARRCRSTAACSK